MSKNHLWIEINVSSEDHVWIRFGSAVNLVILCVHSLALNAVFVLSLKNKIMRKDLTMEERFKLQSKLNDLPRDSANIRVRNRCEITGRTRGVYRKFGLSRIKLRELTMSGALPGVVKSSW